MPGDSLGTAYAEVVLDQTGFKRGLGQAQSSMINWNKTMMKYAKITIGVAGVAALTHQLNSALDASVRFDTALRNVWTLTDATWAEMQKLGDEVANVANQFGATGEEGLKAMYQIYSASFTGRDAMNIFKASLQGAAAGLSDVFTQADLLTTIINAYGMAAEEATHVNDVLFTIIKRGKTTASELGSAFGRLAAVAAPLGASFDDISAALMTLTRQGISTDEAVTAIRNSIVQLARPGKELLALIQSLGYESGTQIISTLGFADALAAVAEAAERNNFPLTDLFTNIRAILAVLPLAGASAAEYAKDLTAAKESAGATSEAFDKQKGKAFELAKAQAELAEANRELGDALQNLIGLEIGVKRFFARLISGLAGAKEALREFNIPEPIEEGPGVDEWGWQRVPDTVISTEEWVKQAAEAGREAASEFLLQYGETFTRAAEKFGPAQAQKMYKYFMDEYLRQFRGSEEEISAATSEFFRAIWEAAGFPTPESLLSEFAPEYPSFIPQMTPEELGFPQLDSAVGEAAETVSALTQAWQALLDEVSDDTFDKFWSELQAASPTVEDLIAKVKAFGTEASGNEDVLSRLHDALEDELDRSRDMVDVLRLFGMDTEDAKERVIALAEALGYTDDELASLREELYGAAEAVKSFAERLSEGQVGDVTTLISEASTKLGEALAGGNWGEIAKAVSDLSFLGGSVKTMQDNLERIITGNFDEATKEAAKKLHDQLIEAGEVLGKTFEEIAADEKRAADKALQEKREAARKEAEEARKRAEALDQAWQNALDALVTAFMGGDMDAVVENMRLLATSSDPDRVLALYRTLYGAIEDEIKLRRLQGKETKELEDRLKTLKVALGDVTEEVETFDIPGAISDWGSVIEKTVSLFDEGAGQIAGALVDVATNIASLNAAGTAGSIVGLVGTVIGLIQDAWEAEQERMRATAEGLIDAFKTVGTTALDVFGKGVRYAATALNRLEASALSLAQSFVNVISQTEAYQRLQAAVNSIQNAIVEGLLAFLWPFVAVLEELFGVTTEVTQTISSEVSARERLLSDLNVPIGWKAARIAYAASTPGEPPIFPEEPVTGGGGEVSIRVPDWIESIVNTWKAAIEGAVAPLREFIDIMRQVGAQLVPAILLKLLPAIESFGDQILDLGKHIKDDLLPVFMSHLPGVLEGFFNFIGGEIVGVATLIVNTLANILPELEDFAQALGGLGANLPDLLAGIAESISPAISDFLSSLAGLVNKITDWLTGGGDELLTAIAGDLATTIGHAITEGLTFLVDTMIALAPAMGEFLDAVGTASSSLLGLGSSLSDALAPVLITVIEGAFTPLTRWIGDTLLPDLKGFFSGFSTWWKSKVDPFLRSDVFPVLGGWLEELYSWLAPIVNFLKNTIWPWLETNVWPILSKFGGVIMDFFEQLGQWVQANWPAISDFLENQLTQVLNNLITDLFHLWQRVAKFLKWLGFDVTVPSGSIPQLAAGGIVTKPTIAMIGERTPEVVLPLDRLGALASDRPIQLQVFLDGQQIRAAVRRRDRLSNLDSGFALEGIG